MNDEFFDWLDECPCQWFLHKSDNAEVEEIEVIEED